MIRAIAFDWGGIFTEGTFDSSAVRSLASRTGRTDDEIGRVYFPLMEEFEAGAFGFDAFTERFLARTDLPLDPDEFRATFLGAVRERTAMYAILGSIPSDYTVGMLSNNVPVLCDRVRSDARMARIEHFVFSNEIGVRKPATEAFESLTGALGVPPEATVFVDDNEANCAAAEALGFDPILLDTFEGFLSRWRERFPELAAGIGADGGDSA